MEPTHLIELTNILREIFYWNKSRCQCLAYPAACDPRYLAFILKMKRIPEQFFTKTFLDC